MYTNYFELTCEPFSIAPDPKFLFMSDQHKEALAHLLYGIQSSGAFILLSGEVGAGKTTVCRCFLEQVPENVDIAFLLNPKLDAKELLASICDELKIVYDDGGSVKALVDAINGFLIENHSKNRNTVVIIEEAQNLSVDVLEQLRLLTNLETNDKKLLQIVLLGQPELLELIEQENLRQLSQRITARFHLRTLSQKDCSNYLRHRLAVAGCNREIFSKSAVKAVYKYSKGVPRLINVLSDRAMLGAYSQGERVVNKDLVKKAAEEIGGYKKASFNINLTQALLAICVLALIVIGFIFSSSKVMFIEQAKESAVGNKSSAPFNSRGSFSTLSSLTLAQDFGDSYGQAVSRLFSEWGVSLSRPYITRDLCDEARFHSLACVNASGNLGTLLKLNRPAILKLLSENGGSYFAYLSHVELKSRDDIQMSSDLDITMIDNFVLNVGGENITLSYYDLEKIWLGEYELLWMPPSGYNGKFIQPGDRGEVVVWLTNSLNQIFRQEREFNPISMIYNNNYVEEVRYLQGQAGIRADGVVGQRTLIYINNLLGVEVPSLYRQR